MHWIEICGDGSYVVDGVEYLLKADGIQPQEPQEGERSGNAWAKSTTPFAIETRHGEFRWEVELIEYLDKGVYSLLGYAITDYPAGVLLKDEVVFRLQDGWAYPNEPFQLVLD